MLKLRAQSFRRYRIHGRIPSPHSDDFYKLVRDRKFLPLTPSEERTYGWATVDNLLMTDFHIESVMRGNWAALGLRVDRRRVNARLLRAHIELELLGQRKAAADAGTRFKLGRDERRRIREELHAELLRQTSPSVDMVPILFHTKHRVAHVLALGKGVNDLMRVHFLDTFGVELIPLTPWRRSQELLEDSPLLEELENAQRTDFSKPPIDMPLAPPPAASMPAERGLVEGVPLEGVPLEGVPLANRPLQDRLADPVATDSGLTGSRGTGRTLASHEPETLQ